MRILLLTLLLAFVVCSQGVSEAQKLPFEQINNAAAKALNILKDPAFAPQLQTVGIKSIEAAREATLGAPLQLFIVRLDELKQYQPGDDPDKLLHAVEQVVYPVTVKGQVVSSVSVSKERGEWTATQIGQGISAPKIAESRTVGARALKTEPVKAFLVRVPALNREFVGYKTEKLMLVPILEEVDLGFKAGAAIPAAKVLEALVPEAQAHQGLPR